MFDESSAGHWRTRVAAVAGILLRPGYGRPSRWSWLQSRADDRAQGSLRIGSGTLGERVEPCHVRLQTAPDRCPVGGTPPLTRPRVPRLNGSPPRPCSPLL